jgi:Ca-activated chloride channel family protein
MSFALFQRRCGNVTVIGIALLVALATIETRGQTSASTPDPKSAIGVEQRTPAPTPTAAPPGNGSTTPELPGGEQPIDDQAATFVFKKEVREVILHGTVVDEQRRLVTNLDRAAFAVFEDGVPQATTSFHRDDVPVAMGIVIDNSGSMRDKRDKVNQAVLNLIRAGNPNDETFVVNFSQEPYLDQDFSSNIDLLQQALQKASTQGSTALYDAIVASSVHLNNNPRLERKILLVITDGRDNASQETLLEATRRLQQENGPILYAIGLLGDELQKSDSGALRSLSESSGGVSFFPQSLDEVDDITRTIARDIRSQYTIGYKPTNHNQNGTYRAIQVRAQARGYRNLTVRTRSGYYAGGTAP